MTEQASGTPQIELPTSPDPPEQSDQTTRQNDDRIKANNFKISFLDHRQEERRPSIQFSVHQSEELLRSDSPRPSRSKSLRRLSSPPPPSIYENRVSFDTFDNKDASDFSFTLRSKHRHYAYTRHSRTFLCGTDQNDYSEFALEWLLDELVDDGDEVICLRVVDKDSKISSTEEGRYRTEARKVLEHIQAKTKDDDKSISLVLEFSVGKVQDSIQSMIKIYEPACLIVGTRGRSLNGIQGLLPGSVSKYCLQNSPVPVIVVRPSSKREKKKRKRRADPARRAYMEMLAKTGEKGSNVFNRIETERALGEASAEASQKEAEAVARAIGIPTEFSASTVLRRKSSKSSELSEGAPLSRTVSGRTDYTSGPESPSPTGGLSPDMSLMDESKSPEMDDLPSPDLDADDEVDEGGEEDDNEDERRASIPTLKLGNDVL